MARQKIDQNHKAESGERLKQYTRIEKEAGPKTASKTLQRRPEPHDDAARTKAFVKIERDLKD